MIRLEEIEKHYPPKIRGFQLGILREYLQYKILEAIYNSEFSHQIIFLGGTALRIVYGSQRFSEDLDFDNISLSKEGFEKLSHLVQKSLQEEGYEVEIRNVYKDAFHCYVKVPKIMHEEGLSAFPEQKIVIRIDVSSQNYDYEPSLFLLDRFGIYQNIRVVPIDLLMAQKFAAILGRKRPKGRDYYDVSWLMSKNIRPDMGFLAQREGLSSIEELKEAVLSRVATADLDLLVENTKSFLLNPGHIARVKGFEKQLRSWTPS